MTVILYRLRRTIRAVCDLQKWQKALEMHVTNTQVPDTFAQAINESRQISNTDEPNVPEILGNIENDPEIIGPLESLITDYFSPNQKTATHQNYSAVVENDQVTVKENTPALFNSCHVSNVKKNLSELM